MELLRIFLTIFISSTCVLSYYEKYPRDLSNNVWDEIEKEADEADETNEISGEELNSKEADFIRKTLNRQKLGDIPLGIAEEEKNVPGEPLTPEDFKNAKSMEHTAPVMDENTPDPIQTAGLFEGDIAGMNASTLQSLLHGRNAIIDMSKKWPDGVIPYVISADFNTRERGVIAAAFHDYQTKTCIRFVPRTNQRNYVYLLKGSGCSSLVGMNGEKQQVSLGAGCVYKGVIIHELMHAVGFWHEQSRADRDNYVTVLWHNIIHGMEFNFNKYGWETIQTLGVPYDTSSVMHYTMLSFSKDGRSPTIIPKQQGVDFIGQRVGFSEKDLMKINRLYQCSDKIQIKPTTPKPIITEDKCMDNHQHCQYWSQRGECMKNPNWMLVNCKKSCNQCGKKCSNYNKDCEFWAKIGECTKNPSYMTIYCAQSCNTCHMTTNELHLCKDDNQYCPSWAADNQCIVNPNYMLKYCRLSCKQC